MTIRSISEDRKQKMIADIMAAEIKAIANVPTSNPYLACVNLFLNSKEQGGKVVVVGLGQSHWLGRKIAGNFNSIGMPSLAMSMTEASTGSLNVLSKHDTFIILSTFGMDAEATDTYALAKRLQPSIPIVVITSKTDSPLSAKADHVLYTGDPDEADPIGLLSSTSNTTMAIIGDILGVMIVHFTNFGAQDYALRQRHNLHEPKPLAEGLSQGRSFSSRETQILEQLARGLKSKEIAKNLGVTHHAVNWALRIIYDKLGVNSKLGAVSVAKSRGILGADVGQT